MIIKDEYEEDVGGGVSQVATTVFNAAWEAGVKIAERAPHSLYISRYQTGRDATVNYPDLDLKFVNDTPKWILVAARLATAGSPSRSTAAGPSAGSRASEGTVRVTGAGADPAHARPDAGEGHARSRRRARRPASRASRGRSTTRGHVLHDETWNTSYRGEYRIIRVGTKPKPKPEAEARSRPPTTTGPTRLRRRRRAAAADAVHRAVAPRP